VISSLSYIDMYVLYGCKQHLFFLYNFFPFHFIPFLDFRPFMMMLLLLLLLLNTSHEMYIYMYIYTDWKGKNESGADGKMIYLLIWRINAAKDGFMKFHIWISIRLLMMMMVLLWNLLHFECENYFPFILFCHILVFSFLQHALLDFWVFYEQKIMTYSCKSVLAN
jgi:hypothetical protein